MTHLRYEYTVVTIRVPWKDGTTSEDWPFEPAQTLILEAMNDLGLKGWQVVEHVWGNIRPANDTLLWPVNIWAKRVIE